jgi:hypothetical protein
MKLITLPLLAIGLLAGCSAGHTAPAASAPTVTVTAATPSTAVAAPTSLAPAAPVTVTVTTTTPAPAPLSAPDAPGQCTDDDLAVTNSPLESANTQRHVTLTSGTRRHSPARFLAIPAQTSSRRPAVC